MEKALCVGSVFRKNPLRANSRQFGPEGCEIEKDQLECEHPGLERLPDRLGPKNWDNPCQTPRKPPMTPANGTSKRSGFEGFAADAAPCAKGTSAKPVPAGGRLKAFLHRQNSERGPPHTRLPPQERQKSVFIVDAKSLAS